MKPRGAGAFVGRASAVLLVALLAFEASLVGRVALLALVDPASTTFQRSEIVRLLFTGQGVDWRQQWRPYDRIAVSLKRAVIASEDAGFTTHGGVDWSTIDRAWQRNAQAASRAERLSARAPRAAEAARIAPAKIVGGSTITQQLAKNLFLSGERTYARKAQEIVIVYALEALLSKRRILEIYLNEVEWGAGVFGAEAAAQRYFRTSAAALGPAQAARLAVMLPAPKLFERRPDSAYLRGRAATVEARMGAVAVP